MDCQSAAQWIQQETTKLALAGGAEMVIPGLHALTIPTGLSYLLHKMGFIGWGIGALKGAYVIETEAYSDLRNILALWANDAHFDASLVEHLALSVESLGWAMTAEGQAAMPKLLQSASDKTMLRTLNILQTLAENYVAGDERGFLVVEAVAGRETAAAMLAEGRANVKPLGGEVILTRPLGRRISRRLAGKLASRLGARIPARFIVGFVPLAGAVANAFFNAQTLQSMAEAAEKYYDRRLRREHLESIDF